MGPGRKENYTLNWGQHFGVLKTLKLFFFHEIFFRHSGVWLFESLWENPSVHYQFHMHVRNLTKAAYQSLNVLKVLLKPTKKYSDENGCNVFEKAKNSAQILKSLANFARRVFLQRCFEWKSAVSADTVRVLPLLGERRPCLVPKFCSSIQRCGWSSGGHYVHFGTDSRIWFETVFSFCYQDDQVFRTKPYRSISNNFWLLKPLQLPYSLQQSPICYLRSNYSI